MSRLGRPPVPVVTRGAGGLHTGRVVSMCWLQTGSRDGTGADPTLTEVEPETPGGGRNRPKKDGFQTI